MPNGRLWPLQAIRDVLQRFTIEPDILIVRRKQYTPSRRQCQVRERCSDSARSNGRHEAADRSQRPLSTPHHKYTNRTYRFPGIAEPREAARFQGTQARFLPSGSPRAACILHRIARKRFFGHWTWSRGICLARRDCRRFCGVCWMSQIGRTSPVKECFGLGRTPSTSRRSDAHTAGNFPECHGPCEMSEAAPRVDTDTSAVRVLNSLVSRTVP
jgi:hypothetical protein